MAEMMGIAPLTAIQIIDGGGGAVLTSLCQANTMR
jgi:hypothetical protein